MTAHTDRNLTHLPNRWVIISHAPPSPQLWTQIITATESFQTFGTNHHCYTAVFGLTFWCFFFLNLSILNLPYYHVWSKLSKKSILPAEIQFYVIFFTKTNILPLVFFQILINNHGFWIFMKIWKKPKDTTLFFEKKQEKLDFQVVKLTFRTILIKHEVVR